MKTVDELELGRAMTDRNGAVMALLEPTLHHDSQERQEIEIQDCFRGREVNFMPALKVYATVTAVALAGPDASDCGPREQETSKLEVVFNLNIFSAED